MKRKLNNDQIIALEEGYSKSSDPESLMFLNMLIEEGHIPQAVVIGNTKKVKKSEEKT